MSEPIVPGMNKKRYESRRRRAASARIAALATAMPERLSFASDGWQTCVVHRISSRRSPGSTHSPKLRCPGARRDSMHTS